MNLDENAVGGLLRMEEVIPAMERALAAFSSGKVVQPTRVMVPVAEHEGFLGLMPAYTGSALGTKLVSFYPHNTEVPTHHATIMLFKPETGEPLVTMDGRLITELRTAAVSAVATDHLANSDASVLAIIGSGVQARSHLEALRLVRGFREVRVWSPRRARAFAEEHGVRAAASAEEAVRGRTWSSRPRPRLCRCSSGSGSCLGYTSTRWARPARTGVSSTTSCSNVPGSSSTRGRRPGRSRGTS
jgi:alanine dehydrogenase